MGEEEVGRRERGFERDNGLGEGNVEVLLGGLFVGHKAAVRRRRLRGQCGRGVGRVRACGFGRAVVVVVNAELIEERLIMRGLESGGKLKGETASRGVAALLRWRVQSIKVAERTDVVRKVCPQGVSIRASCVERDAPSSSAGSKSSSIATTSNREPARGASEGPVTLPER
jgi:hypothetical protein